MDRLSRTHARRGNAIVAAFCVLSLVAVLVAVSTESAISVHGETFHRSHQEEALAAVDAVLAKHEGDLQQMAEEDMLRIWTGGMDAAANATPQQQADAHGKYVPDDQRNYGVDWLGRTAVIWRIEPARTLFAGEDPNATTTVDVMTQNPSPTFSYQPTTPGEFINNFSFMFRIAAEARVQLQPDNNNDPDDAPLAKAQGARYLMYSGEPLFRYAIFYAHDGPKGDLELSHGPAVTIKGGVYSNGAIYLGAGTLSTSWTSLSAPNGPTTIGPDTLGKPVRCVGLDGIFCMSKPLMYRAFNGLASSGTDPGFDPSSFHLGPGYPTTPGSLPIESTAASAALATGNFTYINPYRVGDNAHLATISNATNRRTINKPSNVISGSYSGNTGNASRDLDRVATDKWNPKSLTDFQRKAQSRETNAHKKILPGFMNQRPLEAQALLYPTGAKDDPADDIDEHRKAMPMFLAANGSATWLERAKLFSAPLSFAEIPGQYVRYALGSSDTYFVRNGARNPFDVEFTGWSVRRLDGSVSPTAPTKCGLIVRERPVPDFSYYKGGVPPDLSPADYTHPPYMPFAYGKHKRPYLWPFTEMFISDRGANLSDLAKPWVTVSGSGNNLSDLFNRQEYGYGGYLKFSSAQWTGAAEWGDSPQDPNGFYRSNWRLIHLKRTAPGAVTPWDRRRANMNNASSYFDKGEFVSLQVKLADLSGGFKDGGTTGRKAGLMIVQGDRGASPTEVNLDADGVNARLRYVALLWSPERGFFTQRRLAPSTVMSNSAIPRAYFTNTDDGFATPLAPSNWPGPMATLYHPPGDIATQTLSWIVDQRTDDHAAAYKTIDTGEQLCDFLIGGYSRSFTRIARSKRVEVRIGLKLSNPAPGSFLPGDKGITIFGTPWSMANPTPPAQYRNILYFTPDTIWLRADPGDTEATGGTTGPTVDSSRAVAGNTIYKRYRDGAGNVWNAGKWDEAVALKGGGAAGELALINSLTAKGFTVDTNDPPDLMPPAPAPPNAQPDYTDADIATLFGMTFGSGPNDPNARTFRVNRVPARDVNSYISQRGAWYSPPNEGTGGYSPPANTKNSGLATTYLCLPKDPTLLATTDYPPGSGFPPDQWAGVDGATVDHTPPSSPNTPPEPVTPTAPGGPWKDAQFSNWSVNAAYAVGECVLGNGKVYKCKVAHTASATTKPGSGALWKNDWDEGVALWMRIEKFNNDHTNNLLLFKYYVGTTQGYVPTPSDFTEITDMHGTAARAKTSDWGSEWLVGPVLQSGDGNQVMNTVFSNITLTLWNAGATKVIDQHEWENRLPTEANEYSRYLCSQYQAFWGDKEITEDFFTYGQDDGFAMRTATEDWFWNNREFWSQSRWWNEGDGPRTNWIEKETGRKAAWPLPGYDTPDPNDPTREKEYLASYWRQLMAKTTVLNLNLRVLQDYIASRSLTDATADRIADGSPTIAQVAGGLLRSSFNGLIYAARTNRYPWNPRTELTPAQVTALQASTTAAGGDASLVPLNPFNPTLPNTVAAGNFTPLLDSNLVYSSSATGPFGPLAYNGNPNLPHGSPNSHDGAYAFKSVDFPHGVMLSEASTIDWNGHATYSDSKLTIVTPNALYLKGDVNTSPSATTATGDPQFVPMAVMGDSVTLLSNNWDFPAYQNRVGLKVYDGGVAGGGSLAMACSCNNWLVQAGEYRAEDTSYNTCVVTNNQPTTKDRVRLGEGSAFVNNLLFLENWQGHSMNYLGSLVVLDTCRYTRSFLLEESKGDGRSPFGFMGANGSDLSNGGTGSPDWPSTPKVYLAPQRNLSFNNDLLTRDGEPPFAPFAITPTGMGSWSRVTQ